MLSYPGGLSPEVEGEPLLKFNSEVVLKKPQWRHIHCETCNELEIRWADPTSRSLAVRSRLNDAGVNFKSSPESMVNIPFHLQHRFLGQALCIAQDVTYEALSKHWPHLVARSFLEGPRAVQFGWKELTALTGDMATSPVKTDSGICERPTGILHTALHDMRQLRNTVCHGAHQHLRIVDVYLTRAQKLAVILGDEKSALKIRKLRDQLRIEAQKALAEIETVFLGSWGPMASPTTWRIHHQRLFQQAVDDLACNARSEYDPLPEVVKLAAAEWHHKQGARRVGELDPEYIAAMTKAKAHVIDLRPASPPAQELFNLDGKVQDCSSDEGWTSGDSDCTTLCAQSEGDEHSNASGW